MKITVVVPVYNMGQYLSTCVDSLLRQTFQSYEIILVDDGSVDGSSECCEQEAEKSEKIHVIHKTNGGLSSARNCGINHAKGEYIIFPDPDDWVEPDYLEHLIALLEEENADLSICGFYRFNQKEEKVFDLPPKTVLDMKTALRRHSESSSLKKILNMQCVFQNSDTEKTVHSQTCRFILPTV